MVFGLATDERQICVASLQDEIISNRVSHLIIWFGYYGRLYSSARVSVWRNMNNFLTKWLMRKYKHFARHKTRARRALGKLAASMPKAFIHWVLGYAPMAG
ncbi:MAG TPA: group II intron maturase-specific domain-containing protein [Candidatus Ozemobacteraceae bacterium]|nr:group II intron maturase-specific domain-containing protein [Candidatus Ozemobacteraceae bacterium]